MAISFSPGQVVGQGDWDALFTQHGGMQQSQQSVMRPPTDQEIQAAATGGSDDPAFQQRPIYRYYLSDGSYVEARTSKDGAGWEVVAYQPSQRFQEAQRPGSATNRQGQTTRTEGTPDPSKPGGFDNEHPRMVTRDASGKEIEARDLTPAERKDWQNSREQSRNPGGQTDEQIQAQQQKDDTTVTDVSYTGTGKNRQKVTTYKSGRKVTEAAPTNATATSTSYEQRGGKTVKVTKYDDNTETVEDQGPGTSAPETVTRNGKTYIKYTVKKPDGTSEVYFTDQAGNRVALPDESQIPTNLPPFVPDWSKPGLGAYEYAAMVRARPDMTDAQKAEVITQAHQVVTSTVAQGSSILSSQQAAANQQTTERGQNVSLANQRLSSASSDFSTASKAAADATKYAVGPDAQHVLPYYMALAHAAGSAYGGFNTPPPVQQGAAIRQMQGQTIPGMPTRESLIHGFIPLPGAASERGQPGDPSLADAEAARQAEAAPGRREAAMANPVFRPQPPVNLPPTPVSASSAPGRPAMAAPSMPPAMSSAPAAPDPNVGQLGDPMRQPPAINPITGEPTGLAPLPVNGQFPPMPDMQKTSLAPMIPLPGAQPQQQPFAPSGAGAMLAQRAMTGYDPTGLNRMLAEAGLDPDVIQMLGGVG